MVFTEVRHFKIKLVSKGLNVYVDVRHF